MTARVDRPLANEWRREARKAGLSVSAWVGIMVERGRTVPEPKAEKSRPALSTAGMSEAAAEKVKKGRQKPCIHSIPPSAWCKRCDR